MHTNIRPLAMRRTTILTIAGWLTCLHPTVASSASPTTSLFEAVRANDHVMVRKLLKDGVDLHARDKFGNLPLMRAARTADASVFQSLLKAGAEVNATNSAGMTPLMLAANFPDKVRLLLDHRATVDARSALGNTALILAARAAGSAASVRLLLDHGANVNSTNKFGTTPLIAAVASEDEQIVQLLIDRGANVGAQPNLDLSGLTDGGARTPLQWAAFRGNEALVKLFLARGSDVNQFTLVGAALAQAAWGGHEKVARLLLDAGAQVDQRDLLANFTPLHWAASSENSSPALVNLLLARGADVNAEGGQPVDGFLGVTKTPLDLARQRGETPIVAALLKAGAKSAAPTSNRREAKPLRPAVDAANLETFAATIQRAILPLQKSADDSYASFRRHVSKQDCVSCHQQQLPVAAFGRVHARTIAMNRDDSKRQLDYVVRELGLLRHPDQEPTFHPAPAITHGYSLFALRLENQPALPETDILVHLLATIQSADGSWCANLPRPPIQSSDMTATALAVHGLRYFGQPGRKPEFAQRIERARAWMQNAKAESNEERAYQLLGLFWAGEGSGTLKRRAGDLIAQQRPDGGWSQLPALPSDAYATGLSLFALVESGAVAAKDRAVQDGLRYLQRTQLEDGTWHVRRRAFPFQPPMDSGFPHGADGWISGAATSWAVLALATAMDPLEVSSVSPGFIAKSKLATPPAGNVVQALAPTASAPVDFARDIQPILERSCVSCHSGERAKGGFVMDSRTSLLKGGNRGEAVVVVNHSAQSPLLQFVSDQVEDLEMPPVGKRDKFPSLTTDEVGRLRTWIDQGAGWPESVTLRPPNE